MFSRFGQGSNVILLAVRFRKSLTCLDVTFANQEYRQTMLEFKALVTISLGMGKV
jgi:hypothetical protein